MSETKLATVRFGIRPDVIDDTEIQNLIESYHREYINTFEKAWIRQIGTLFCNL